MTARRVARLAGRAIGALVLFGFGFPIAYAATVREQRPQLPANASLPMPVAGSYRVFVADWGYHTAIIVEQPRGWRLGPPGEEAAPFLEYAWGDRRFYLESDYRPHSLFATLVLPTETVTYLDGRPNPPRLGGAEAVVVRTVDAATVRALLMELERSIRRDVYGARHRAYPVTAGYGGRFYPAHGAYLWARDCNWWTVARLAAVGLAGSATGVMFTTQVPGRLRGFTEMTTE